MLRKLRSAVVVTGAIGLVITAATLTVLAELGLSPLTGRAASPKVTSTHRRCWLERCWR